MTQASRPLESVSLPASRGRILVAVLLAGSIGAALVSLSRWSEDPRRWLYSYLTALVFVITPSIGALAWLMLQHLTRAVWSVVLRRVLENLTRPLPWLALGFIPVALHLPRIYSWADPARVASDPALARKSAWLNPVFFNIRAAAYLAIWALLATLLARFSARQDRLADPRSNGRMRAISSWGLVLLGLTSSYAGFDWLMSLDPHWASTMYGVYVWAGSLVSSLAALILLTLALRGSGWLGRTVTTEHLHDLGKLLFGFVVFWTYIAFCQYFLIWCANFPEETRWYITRRSGSWNTLSWALCFGHFTVPFFLLLFRSIRRDPYWLGFLAAWILVFHYLDLYWLIMPELYPEGAQPDWLDGSLLAALLLASCTIVAHACRTRPVVPIGDPRLSESIAFQNS
ncbi:MAG: hypothetical protein WBQ11_22170 [Isosphaeraceae bacterium]